MIQRLVILILGMYPLSVHAHDQGNLLSSPILSSASALPPQQNSPSPSPQVNRLRAERPQEHPVFVDDDDRPQPSTWYCRPNVAKRLLFGMIFVVGVTQITLGWLGNVSPNSEVINDTPMYCYPENNNPSRAATLLGMGIGFSITSLMALYSTFM